MKIPKDKDYPPEAVQCDKCGGHGCDACGRRGWYADPEHPSGRLCDNDACSRPLPPNHVAVYCANECALEDA